jgi:hypothetical protein
MLAEVILVDDEQVAPEPLITHAHVDKWFKEIEEKKRQEQIQRRKDAEDRFREDVHVAFFDANPNATERDFQRLYGALRDQCMQEQTRVLLEAQASRVDIGDPRSFLRGAYRDLFLGKRFAK